MVDAPALERVSVNGREIAPEVIAAEAQHHPAPDAAQAWQAAAEALVVRALLLEEAGRLEIDARGMTDDEGRPLAPEEALIEALLAAEVRTPTADEASCRRYYEQHPDRFRSAPVVEAEHILFAASPDDPLAYGLATGDARIAIRRLQAEPEAFAELARSHSACPSKEQGGNLGQLTRGQTVPEFEEALFALAEGELCTRPVKTRFGVHVIRSGRKEESRQLPFDLVQGRIAAYLEEASWRRAVAQYVTILSGRARIEGIDLGNESGPLVQ